MAVVGHRKDGQRGQEEAREEELCQKQDTERCNLVQEMALMEWVVGQEEAHPGGYTLEVEQKVEGKGR